MSTYFAVVWGLDKSNMIHFKFHVFKGSLMLMITHAHTHLKFAVLAWSLGAGRGKHDVQKCLLQGITFFLTDVTYEKSHMLVPLCCTKIVFLKGLLIPITVRKYNSNHQYPPDYNLLCTNAGQLSPAS